MIDPIEIGRIDLGMLKNLMKIAMRKNFGYNSYIILIRLLE